MNADANGCDLEIKHANFACIFCMVPVKMCTVIDKICS
jgi:hypothetical protein